MILFLHFCYNLKFIIAGQEQHVGTKAPPPEIVLENAVMREPAIVRVQVIYQKNCKMMAFVKYLSSSTDSSKNFDSGQSLLPSGG